MTGGEVRIGGKDGEFVSLRRLTQNDPGGWFDAEVEVQCDGWQGKIRTSFMHGELARFAEEIEVLYGDLRGEATLQPIESHLTLSFTGDGKGHIEVVGTAQNHFTRGTKLSFSLEADQTYLPAIVKALRAAESSERL
jgi:hypothetical protein